MVKNGYAWWFEKYSSNQKIKELEAEARRKKVGLWAENNPTSPWQWRVEQQTRKRENGKDSDPQEAVVSSNVNQKTIYTGPRGGKFYINSHGNKTYIRRK